MKTLIWTLPTRIFHWLLAIGFTLAYFLGDNDELRRLHVGFGAAVGTLLLFRIFFGFFGPKYSHFRDFPVSIKKQVEFFKSIKNKTTGFIGHNPAASLVMLSIMLIGIFCSLSGYLMYSGNYLGFNEHSLEETHEILANLFLFMVIMHLAGTLLDTILHKQTGTLPSIFTGYKNVEAEPARLSGFMKTYSILWLVVPFIIFFLAYNMPVKEEGDFRQEKSVQFDKSEATGKEHDD
ncbi:MAG: cytochrome b/b6 domain-containing protein [Bacteroidales bacterium]